MRNQRCQIQRQGKAVAYVYRCQPAQQYGIESQCHGRQLHKGQQAIEHDKGGGLQIADKYREGREISGFVGNSVQIHGQISHHTAQQIQKSRNQQATHAGEHHQNQKCSGRTAGFPFHAVPPSGKQVSVGGRKTKTHAPSSSIPWRRRRRVSSRPRMWQISTAPPGVTSLPAAAMRTGHIRVAFLTSSRAARSIRASWMAS